MIAKQTKGRGFRGLLEYLESKEGAKEIDSNMLGLSPRSKASEFGISRQLRPEIKKPVYHASLSLPLGQSLDDLTWRSIIHDYLEGMGFSNCQFTAVRHVEKEHDHVHIVASRITLDGELVDDSWDYRRSEVLVRALEQKYQLTPTTPSWEKERRGQTTGEYRQLERTGEDSIRLKLQALIDRASLAAPSMPELLHTLKDQGVDARVTYTRTSKVKGISYELDGIAFSGTHLGKAYTFPGLQKYRGIEYKSAQDPEIQAASIRMPVVVAAITDQQKELERQRQQQEALRQKELERQRQQYEALRQLELERKRQEEEQKRIEELKRLEEQKQSFDRYQRIKQFYENAQTALSALGKLDPLQPNTLIYVGTMYKLTCNQTSLRVFGLDGRGEILSYPYKFSFPETKAEASFTNADFDLFSENAQMIRDAQAHKVIEKQQQQDRSRSQSKDRGFELD
jgi:Relaxase/Mobilisation nuclease domain